MSERRGRCPGLFDPMPSGDGLLVRVKPPGMALPAETASALAEAASRHGNGVVELTSRGNLQIRGLSSESVRPFAEAMIACGLASADPGSERRRIATISPLLGDDPSLAPETAAIAAEIERGLLADARFAALPAKFWIVVDGGGILPLHDIRADVSVRAVADGFAVVFDGGERAAECRSGDAAMLVVRLVGAFIQLSGRPAQRPDRMGDLVRELGAEAILATAFEREPLLRAPARPPSPTLSPRWRLGDLQIRGTANFLPLPLREGAGGRGRGQTVRADIGEGAHAGRPIGFIPYRTKGRGAFGLGIPFESMHSKELASLAELSRRWADGKLRLTPWRAVLLGGVAERDAAELAAAASAAGMIVDPADPRLRVIACAGAPSCSAASVTTRADAAALARALPASFDTVHVSGCRKGCAHRGPAAFTLVGEAGRYNLVRNGGASDAPEVAGLSASEACRLLQREIAA